MRNLEFFKVKMSPFVTCFCFLHLKGIGYFHITHLLFFPSPWSIFVLSKREKNLFFLPNAFRELPPYCLLGCHALSCQPRAVSMKRKARPEFFTPLREPTPSITALIIKEESCCLRRMERCPCLPLPSSKVVKKPT